MIVREKKRTPDQIQYEGEIVQVEDKRPKEAYAIRLVVWIKNRHLSRPDPVSYVCTITLVKLSESI